MANQEQLDILKQGVDVWNKWRQENERVKIDLWGANLDAADLSQADLNQAYLREACLRRTNLRSTNLMGAVLIEAELYEADLTEADLLLANLSGAYLIWANLSGAFLFEAHLIRANLSSANLSGAYFRGSDLSGARFNKSDFNGADLWLANLRQADLRYANLENAKMGFTQFGETDLTKTLGLEGVLHAGPSYVDTQTIQLFKGKIPETFLRGCGLSDWEIESTKLYNPDLTNEEIVKIQYRMFDLRATQALQISPLFISYSHADTAFVDRLDTSLIQKGVRFWRDIHDATAGRLETQIDRAIRQNPTVLLVLSKNSIKSDWVEHEVRKARELEKELGRDALCPVALDDGWKSSPWPKRVMEQIMEYNILDFSGWEDQSTFEGKFAKLLSGLDLFYKKPEKV